MYPVLTSQWGMSTWTGGGPRKPWSVLQMDRARIDETLAGIPGAAFNTMSAINFAIPELSSATESTHHP